MPRCARACVCVCVRACVCASARLGYSSLTTSAPSSWQWERSGRVAGGSRTTRGLCGDQTGPLRGRPAAVSPVSTVTVPSVSPLLHALETLKTAAYCPWRNNTGPVLYNAPVQEEKRSLTVPTTCVRALLSGPADRDGRTKSTIQTPAASPRQGLDTTTPTGHATPIHHATRPFQAQRRNLVCFYNWNKSGID